MTKRAAKLDTWTRPIAEIIAWIRTAELWLRAGELIRLFDENSSFEIREACADRLRGYPNPKVQRWFLQRIDQFAQANNHETVYILIRNGLWCEGIERKVISRLVAFLRRQDCWYPIRDFTLLLCDWIIRHPESYNREARDYFREVLEKNHASTYSGTNEEFSRMLREMLRAIGTVGDTSFLLLIEGELDEEEVAKIFRYSSIHEELIAYHGARLLVVQHLKQIKKRKVARRQAKVAQTSS